MSAPRRVPNWAAPLADSAARNRETIARLVPIARWLLRSRGGAGATIDELRQEAVRRGVLTGEEGMATGRQRAVSFLGAVFRKSGAVAKICECCDQPIMRRSEIDRSHGNLMVVWVMPPLLHVGRDKWDAIGRELEQRGGEAPPPVLQQDIFGATET